jgi:hypothetical protein
MLKVIVAAWGAWGGLGIYRGVKLYNYEYNCKFISYKKEKEKYYKKEKEKYFFLEPEKPNYFYAECFGYGIFGGFIYINPFTLVLSISKELYRLEVNIRGINEEKEKRSFYEFS